MSSVRLAAYDNSDYHPGRPLPVLALWLWIGLPLLRAPWNPSSSLRRRLLRLFGSSVGQAVVIKPGVRVKYPWFLRVGDHAWLGEDVWIDNLAPVEIGSNVCISQGAYLCTGNHDWSDPAFGLKLGPIRIRDGAWIGAKAIVCPGITAAEGSVATAGSVVTKDLDPYTVYAGNPAVMLKPRRIIDSTPATGLAAGVEHSA